MVQALAAAREILDAPRAARGDDGAARRRVRVRL